MIIEISTSTGSTVTCDSSLESSYHVDENPTVCVQKFLVVVELRRYGVSPFPSNLFRSLGVPSSYLPLQVLPSLPPLIFLHDTCDSFTYLGGRSGSGVTCVGSCLPLSLNHWIVKLSTVVEVRRNFPSSSKFVESFGIWLYGLIVLVYFYCTVNNLVHSTF